MTELSGWQNFYVIVGSSAGALIGLQFVVMTLIADIPLRDGAAQAGNTYGTPTIVHFGAVLLLAGIVSMPWHSVVPAAVCWAVLGIAGVIYIAVIARRMRLQHIYRPEFEDWLFHAVVPLVAYAMLAAAGFASVSYSHAALFLVAAASLLLLFDGIHNAWDAVTYHVYSQRRKHQDSESRPTTQDR